MKQNIAYIWNRTTVMLIILATLVNLRISQRRLLLDDLWEYTDFEDVVDETEHKEADDADLHLNKLKNSVHK